LILALFRKKTPKAPFKKSKGLYVKTNYPRPSIEGNLEAVDLSPPVSSPSWRAFFDLILAFRKVVTS
jgi:hypothetical protein